MKRLNLRQLLFFFFIPVLCLAQMESSDSEIPELTSKDSIVSSSWIVELGYSFIEDSGDGFKDFTPIKDQWNAVPYPATVSLGRYFDSGIGIELIGAYSKYNSGNNIEDIIIEEDIDYFALDTRVSYDLNKIIGQTGFFDPYIGAGLGYSNAVNVGRTTYNAVVGFRVWFSDRWALDLNSTGKWAFDLSGERTNHVQHRLGVAYQFNIEKELSKKGKKKLALINALEAEQQRIQDSISAAQNAEKARLAAAEEAARLAELAKKEAANKTARERKNYMINELDSLGAIYFAYNSSFLNEPSKKVLKELAAYLEKYPDARVEIEAHADSRGTVKYNDWLSERRAGRVGDFLENLGVDPGRLSLQGLGERQILNECTDGVRCTEAQHKLNRRAKFTLQE